MKIINVMGVSLDGKIATEHLENDAARMAIGFGAKADQEHVRRQISQADAVITGANSMRASRGAWEQTGKGGQYPQWIVMTRSGLAPDLRFWQQREIPRTVLSPDTLPDFPDTDVTNLVSGNRHPGKVACDYLREKGAKTVLLFGGGQINRIFYEKDLVDELKITISPLIVGLDDVPQFVVPQLPHRVKLELLSSHSQGNHVFLHYRILKKILT